MGSSRNDCGSILGHLAAEQLPGAVVDVADVVAWIVANFDGDKDQIPELKFITAGKTLCERQIANLSEVVQAIFDNMANLN